jgi:hypothetical protein
MFASRFATRAIPAFKQSARKFSGHSAEQAEAEVKRWYNLTLGKY